MAVSRTRTGTSPTLHCLNDYGGTIMIVPVPMPPLFRIDGAQAIWAGRMLQILRV